MLMQITVFVQALDRSAAHVSTVTDSIRSCVMEIAGVTAVEIESRHAGIARQMSESPSVQREGHLLSKS
jgi:hypothetical protein